MTTVINHTERTTHPATVNLPYEPQSASAARRMVRNKLTEWGLADVIDTAELIVSELVGNACKTGCMRHMTVALRVPSPTTVRVSVRDSSRTLPVLIDAGDNAEGGRGLALVNQLSKRWGVAEAPFGKIVWADLAVPT